MSKKGRPTAECVLVEGTFAAAVVVEAFDLTSTMQTLPDQLHDLASGLRSRLTGLKPDKVVVRRADFPPRPSNQEGPRLRLLAEGALAAAAKDEVSDVVLATGKDLAAGVAMSKGALDARGHALRADAAIVAAAALAGMT